MNRRTVLALGAGAVVPIAGCLGDTGGSESNGNTVEKNTVEVSEMGYKPRKLSIDVGATVTWVNENSTVVPAHTVTSKQIIKGAEEWSLDERLEESGDTVSHTFEEAGLYTYVGTIKGEDCMCGLVAVGDASYGDPLPCSPVRGGGCR